MGRPKERVDTMAYRSYRQVIHQGGVAALQQRAYDYDFHDVMELLRHYIERADRPYTVHTERDILYKIERLRNGNERRTILDGNHRIGTGMMAWKVIHMLVPPNHEEIHVQKIWNHSTNQKHDHSQSVPLGMVAHYIAGQDGTQSAYLPRKQQVRIWRRIMTLQAGFDKRELLELARRENSESVILAKAFITIYEHFSKHPGDMVKFAVACEQCRMYTREELASDSEGERASMELFISTNYPSKPISSYEALVVRMLTGLSPEEQDELDDKLMTIKLPFDQHIDRNPKKDGLTLALRAYVQLRSNDPKTLNKLTPEDVGEEFDALIPHESALDSLSNPGQLLRRRIEFAEELRDFTEAYAQSVYPEENSKSLTGTARTVGREADKMHSKFSYPSGAERRYPVSISSTGPLLMVLRYHANRGRLEPHVMRDVLHVVYSYLLARTIRGNPASGMSSFIPRYTRDVARFIANSPASSAELSAQLVEMITMEFAKLDRVMAPLPLDRAAKDAATAPLDKKTMYLLHKLAEDQGAGKYGPQINISNCQLDHYDPSYKSTLRYNDTLGAMGLTGRNQKFGTTPFPDKLAAYNADNLHSTSVARAHALNWTDEAILINGQWIASEALKSVIDLYRIGLEHKGKDLLRAGSWQEAVVKDLEKRLSRTRVEVKCNKKYVALKTRGAQVMTLEPQRERLRLCIPSKDSREIEALNAQFEVSQMGVAFEETTRTTSGSIYAIDLDEQGAQLLGNIADLIIAHSHKPTIKPKRKTARRAALRSTQAYVAGD